MPKSACCFIEKSGYTIKDFMQRRKYQTSHMLYKKNTLFGYIFKNITMLQPVLMEEVPFKIVKIIFMITPENSSRDLLMSRK